MRSWSALRAHRRSGRQLSREIAELTHVAAGAAAARDVTRRVLDDLGRQPYPGNASVAATVAAHCANDGQRSALAAYLYLCRDMSFDALGKVFGVDPAAARRLVERGTGTAPVTGGDECRGWALVAPRPGRTAPERQAASGHLGLCRKCRYKLRAHALLEQRVAAAGSVAFGASVTAAVGRAVAGSHAVGSAAGALTAPIVALSTAAALTAGAGTFAVTTHGGDRHRTRPGTVRPHPGATAGVQTTPAAQSRPAPVPARTDPPAGSRPTGSRPDLPRGRQLPVPGVTAVPLPQVTVPALPRPTVSVSPPALPPGLPVPVPVPTLSLPPLP